MKTLKDFRQELADTREQIGAGIQTVVTLCALAFAALAGVLLVMLAGGR